MARPVVVTDKDLGFNKILLDMGKFNTAEVLVGIQEGSKTQAASKDDHIRKAGESIVAYATQNEFGTDKIPERSFMRSTFDENLEINESYVERQYQRVIDGKKTVKQALGEIGNVLQDEIKGKIRSLRTPPNARSTIIKKGSSNPLIDFGQMFAAVRYVIKMRK